MNATRREHLPVFSSELPDELMHQMLEQWPGAVLLLDEGARLHWCNEAARRLSGCEQIDLRGCSWEALRMPWSIAAADFAAVAAGESRDIQSSAALRAVGDGHQETAGIATLRLRPVHLDARRTAILCLIDLQSGAAAQVTPRDHEQSFDAAQAGIWRWNLASGEGAVDEQWCLQLQLDPASGPNHSARWAAQIHPDDIADFRRRLAELQRGAIQYFEAEYRMLTQDNRWLWILQRGRVVARSVEGAPLRAIGLCIDIDQRKREETTLKANGSRLATALWGARASFWQWHLPTDVRTVSPMWYAMTRYTREQWESITDPWESRLHSEDAPLVAAAMKNYQDGGSDSLEYEYRLRTATGEWKWLMDRARAVEWDLEGKPAVIMGVSLDIDAQKRTEMELRTSEARLQTAVWGARMGLWELDFKTDTTLWFDNWCDQYGVDACDGGDHVSRWDSRIHPDDVAEAARRFAEHVAGNQDYYDSEYRIMTSAGNWRWIFERGRVVERDESGDALRMVGVCMDIDARRQEELRRASART